MKHNSVFLCGWVQEPPRILKNDKTNEYVEAKAKIVTLRGIRKFGTKINNIKYDEPLIYTANPEMCKQIASWSVGDIVEVKGSSTKGGEFMKIFEKVVYLLTSIRIPTNCD